MRSFEDSTAQATFTSILSGGAYRVERMLKVYKNTSGFNTFYDDKIVSMKIESDMLGSSTDSDGYPKVAAFASMMLEVELVAPGVTFDRNAKVEPYIRLVELNGAERVSEWLIKGTYYIYTRDDSDPDDLNTISLTCYDAAIKANSIYLAEEGEQGQWPKTDSVIYSTALTELGLLSDAATVASMNKSYTIDWPGMKEDEGYTLRDVLASIAGMYGGVFIITEDRKLRLVKLNGYISQETSYTIDKYESYSSSKAKDAIATIAVYDGTTDENGGYNGNHYPSAGEDFIYEITVPWITDDMSEDIYDILGGFVYQPYSITNAVVTPMIEIGDKITVDTITSGVYKMTQYCDDFFDVDFEAVGSDEEDVEFSDKSLTAKLDEVSTVKTGTTYYGTKITRQHGLEVSRKNSSGTEVASVRLNADELSFYKGSEQVIYFDADQNKYVFKGAIIVQGDMEFIKTKYTDSSTVDPPASGEQPSSSWYDEWQDSWTNNYTEVWAIYSYDAGASWTTHKTMVQGKNGQQGEPGSSASIPQWVTAYTNGAQYDTLVSGEWVIAMNLYGSKIYSSNTGTGSATSYSLMDGDGFHIRTSSDADKILIGMEAETTGDTPYITFGIGGSGSTTAYKGCIEKFVNGFWFGNDEAMGSGTEPATTSGITGIWVDFQDNKIYKYENGTKSEIGEGGGGTSGSIYLVYA